MIIEECYKCGVPVRECTEWDISLELGLVCENCNPKKNLTDEEYRENAAFLKSLSKKGSK